MSASPRSAPCSTPRWRLCPGGAQILVAGMKHGQELNELGEVGQRAGQPVDLVDDDVYRLARTASSRFSKQASPSTRRKHPPLVEVLRQLSAFVGLALDVGRLVGGWRMRFCRGWRADRDGGRGSVPAVLPAGGSPPRLLPRPHSRGHLYVTSYTEGLSHFVTSMTVRLPAGFFGLPEKRQKRDVGASEPGPAPPLNRNPVVATKWEKQKARHGF